MFKDTLFLEQAHSVFITKANNSLRGLLSLYGGAFETIIILCDDFSKTFNTDGYICDWQNKKEYTLTEYLKILQDKEYTI
jgi:hypothetical protein